MNERWTNATILADPVSDNRWALKLTLLCCCLMGYGLLFSHNTCNKTLYLLGSSLPSAVVIWIFFHFLTGYKHRDKNTFHAFLAVYASLIASGYIASMHNTAEHALPSRAAATDNTLFHYQAFHTSVHPPLAEDVVRQPNEIPPTLHGHLDEMDRFMNTMLHRCASVRSAYHTAVEQVHLQKVFDYRRIKDREAHQENLSILHSMKHLIQQYRQKSYHVLEELKTEIATLHLNQADKQTLRAGINQALRDPTSDFNTIWDLEEKVVNEVALLLDMLDATRQQWTVDADDEVVFAKASALYLFQHHIDAIQYTLEAQKELANDGVPQLEFLFAHQ